PFAVIDVVLEADPYMSAKRDRERCHRRLVSSYSGDRPGASFGDGPGEVEQILGRGSGRSRDAEDEFEVKRRRELAFGKEPVGGREHAVVEDLQLRRNGELLNAPQDRPDRRNRVLEDVVAEVARAGRQRGHLGRQFEGGASLLAPT